MQALHAEILTGATRAFQRHHAPLLCFLETVHVRNQSRRVDGMVDKQVGGADRGVSIQRGPAGLDSYSAVPSATHHQENQFVDRACLKSSTPSRRLLSLSVDDALPCLALHSPCVARLSSSTPCSAQPLTWWAVPLAVKPISTVHSLGHPVYLNLKPPAPRAECVCAPFSCSRTGPPSKVRRTWWPPSCLRPCASTEAQLPKRAPWRAASPNTAN